MNCPKCNTLNDVNSKFCMSCGNDLSVSPVNPAPQNVNPTNMNVGQPNMVNNVNPVNVSGPDVSSQPSVPNVSQPNMVNNVNPVNVSGPDVSSQPSVPNVSQPNMFNNVNPVNVSNPNVSVQPSVPNFNQTNMNVSQPNVTNNNTQSKKSFPKILIPIILVIVAGLAVAGFLLFGGKPSETELLDAIFDPDKPIVIKKDGKYGYITSKGKMMIEPRFESAGDFVGKYAVVSVENDESSYYDKYQIINKKGEVIIESDSYSSPKYYSTYGVWVIDGTLYNSDLKPITAEGIEVSSIGSGYFEYEDPMTIKSGIMDYKGKIVFSWEGMSISADVSTNSYDDTDLYAEVKSYSEPEKHVVVSLKTGKILYTVADPDKTYLTENGDGTFYYYDDSNYSSRRYLYFTDGKLAYESTEPLYDLEVYDYENKILEIDYGYDYADDGKEQRYYYYNVKTKKTSTEKPTLAEDDLDEETLVYGYKTYYSSGKYGLMSGDKVLLPCVYDDIDFLNPTLFKYMKMKKNKEIVLVEKDDKIVILNVKNQDELGVLDASYAYDYDDSTFIKASVYEGYKTTGYVVYNLLSGKSMTFTKEESPSIYSNYITITRDNQKIYYNTKLEQIYVEQIK